MQDRVQLPLVVIADTSGSMNGSKIRVVNASIATLCRRAHEWQDHNSSFEVLLGVVAFGGDEARVHAHLLPIGECEIEPLTPFGGSPLGAGLAAACDMIADYQASNPHCVLPQLILVSDGRPTDGEAWRLALSRLMNMPLTRQSGRYSVRIGADALSEEESSALRSFASDGTISAADVDSLFDYFDLLQFNDRLEAYDLQGSRNNPPSMRSSEAQ